MARPIYVIGHKNSDMDSAASAYAYGMLYFLVKMSLTGLLLSVLLSILIFVQ
jgi:inorganic pyrophosphatase/exopolyphosphatase